jgi:hypothetical protein
MLCFNLGFGGFDTQPVWKRLILIINEAFTVNLRFRLLLRLVELGDGTRASARFNGQSGTAQKTPGARLKIVS